MGTESNPVNECGHHGCVFKQLSPFGKGKIRCHDGTALFSSIRDYLKEQFRLMAVETEIAQFIQNQEISLRKGSLQLAETVEIFRFTKFR